MNEEREWMSPEELWEWLGIGKTKCYEMLAHGEIPSYKIGSLRRIKRTDVERWLEDRRSAASENL